MSIDTKYFKEYRAKLGFSNEKNVKLFFGAKDIIPTVDYNYIELLNNRLIEIVKKLNELVADIIKIEDIDTFCNENIKLVFEKLRDNSIISRLNNQGRRREEVYFSWMRGHLISTYFKNTFNQIFEVNNEDIVLCGGDDLLNIELFKRSPKADWQVNFKNNTKMMIEVQSGFQGINDIKQHKVLEAKKAKREQNISSLVIHFDLFNGQVAFVKIDEIDEDSMNWITRQQMEGQTVFNIDQNYFLWKLIDNPTLFKDLIFS